MKHDIQRDIAIRTATKADIPEILKLYEQLQPQDTPIDENAATAAFEAALSNKVVYFVAEAEGSVVGTCYIAFIPNITKNCSPIGYVENVVVSDVHRRMGIGRKLMETVIEYAGAQGCYKITLQSGIGRAEAHRFYESIGFNGNSKRAFEIRY